MRSCDNCEKLKVCWVKKDNSGVVNCGEWSGWIPVEEELPEEGSCIITLHKVCGKIGYTVCDFSEGHFDDGINPNELMERTLIAWHKLPKRRGGKE